MGEWIVYFQGRNHSTAIKLNFLWKDHNIFIMDNHRAALWCWLSSIKDHPDVGLFHVDRHYDALFSVKDYVHFPHEDFNSLSIDEYLSCGYDNDFFAVTPLFRWDNYLGLFIEKYRNQVREWAFATHGKGAAPKDIPFAAYEPWEFPAGLYELKGKWIFNLDLDYFFGRMSSGKMERLFTDVYVRDFSKALRAGLDSGVIVALTVSLSPECAGGWEGTEEVLKLITEGLEIDFSLPASPDLEHSI
ncbi:UPF0489 family protein [Maridesulfovibrio ferrireducens]|uniref:UPF0489 family protein n=1 Tax=Maridesulfovibrio ferrireducens TaxID=246191 RepID=UPI001A2FB9BF|nr:UPF0489 family protein [Maridesulfovibrio ferrireducens]MBI9112546.1 UPF0489 family protein [Maridesulfovibrio ferrireducens]